MTKSQLHRGSASKKATEEGDGGGGANGGSCVEVKCVGYSMLKKSRGNAACRTVWGILRCPTEEYETELLNAAKVL